MRVLAIVLGMFCWSILSTGPQTLYVVTEDARQRIVVIDTGVSRKQYDKSFMCKDFRAFSMVPAVNEFDGHGHGTNIIGIIADRIDTEKYCITSIKYYHKSTDSDAGIHLTRAFNLASTLPFVVAVNLSGGGRGRFTPEEDIVFKLVKQGITMVFAAGNDGINLRVGRCYWPACTKYLKRFEKYKNNIHVVGGLNNLMLRMPSSNWSDTLEMDYCVGLRVGTSKMSGTSQATAVNTGELFSNNKGEDNDASQCNRKIVQNKRLEER